MELPRVATVRCAGRSLRYQSCAVPACLERTGLGAGIPAETGQAVPAVGILEYEVVEYSTFDFPTDRQTGC